MAEVRRTLASLASRLAERARKRPREMFLAACLAALLGAWLGTVYLADHLLSSIPEQTAPEGPRPLTQDEIQEQIREAQEINRRLLAERAAAREYVLERAREAD